MMPEPLCVTVCESPAAAWDAFAARCGASFRCARRALSLWQFDHHLFHRMRRLEIHVGRNGAMHKIGQCAVGIGRRRRVFADSLQLLPEYRHRWADAMRAVLQVLGPGEYHYGSQWNLEEPREEVLARLPGVSVTHVEALTIDVVDFSQWPSWDAYFRAVSSNAKRNAKRAQEQFPDMQVQVRSGMGALRSWLALHRLRSMLAERKHLRIGGLLGLARFAMRTAALGGENFTAILHCGGEPAAGFAGLDFGPNTYYLQAGSQAHNGGAAWHLMLTMLARAYKRRPQGRFVMGAQYASQPRDEGLAFSRRQVRVSLVPTSEIIFRYETPRLTIVSPSVTPVTAREQIAQLPVAARLGLGLGTPAHLK